MTINPSVFNPNGFSHVEKIGGKPRQYSKTFDMQASTDGATTYATSVAAGDPAAFIANGYVGLQTIPTDGATSVQIGIGTFVSFRYTDVNRNVQYTKMWVANTPVLAGTLPQAIIDLDPGSVFTVQCNAALGLAANQTAIGKNYNYGTNGINTNTQTSLSYLNVATGGGNQVWRSHKIIGLAEIPNNLWNSPFPIVEVVVNNHVLKPGSVGNN